jgi:hypothetical protein
MSLRGYSSYCATIGIRPRKMETGCRSSSEISSRNFVSTSCGILEESLKISGRSVVDSCLHGRLYISVALLSGVLMETLDIYPCGYHFTSIGQSIRANVYLCRLNSLIGVLICT